MLIKKSKEKTDKVISFNLINRHRDNADDSEKYLWDMLRNRRLDNLRFRSRQVVCGFIVDFYCPEINLAIEIERSLTDNYIQREFNGWKEKIFSRNGINCLRFKDYEVLMSPDSVRERIRGFV